MRRFLRACVRFVWADGALFHAACLGDAALARRALAWGANTRWVYSAWPPPDSSPTVVAAYMRCTLRHKTALDVAVERGHREVEQLVRAARWASPLALG